MIPRIFALCMIAVIIAGCRPVGEIKLGTGGKQGHYYKLGKHLDDISPSINVISTGGSADNLERLKRGEINFALIQSGIPTDANIGAVATVGEQYVHVLVRKDLPYQTLRDVQRDVVANIGIGQRGSGTAHLGKRVFDYYPVPTTPTRIKDMLAIDGHPWYSDVQFSVTPTALSAVVFEVYSLHTPIIEHALRTGNYRLLPIPTNEAIAHAIPGCYPGVLTPGLYGMQRDIPANPTPTLKVKTLLVTRRDVSARKVKHMLRTLYRSKHPDLVELTEKVGAETYGVPLHPAAEDYYQRNEPVSSDKFEIGGVILASIIFLGSLIQILLQRVQSHKINKQRRRIQPYFDNLSEMGVRIERAHSIHALEIILTEIMTIQGAAEKPWLRGELDTEHMENLYAIASARSQYAESKLRLLLYKRGIA